MEVSRISRCSKTILTDFNPKQTGPSGTLQRPPGNAAPADGRSGAVVQFIGRVMRRGRWPYMIHSQHGHRDSDRSYLRLSQTAGYNWFDMRSVCRAHGPNCTRSASCRSARPVGHLWAWLEYGSQPGISEEQHKQFAPTFEQRQVARSEFLALAGADEWFAVEADGADWEVEDD